MKGMHIKLDSWHPHHDSEVCKQAPYGLNGDLVEDNLRFEAEEALVQINRTPSKGGASENGEPMMVRAAQCWLNDLQVLKILIRYTDSRYNICAPIKYVQPCIS